MIIISSSSSSSSVGAWRFIRQVCMYLIWASWEKEGTCTVHVPKHGLNDHDLSNHIPAFRYMVIIFSKGVRSVPDKLTWVYRLCEAGNHPSMISSSSSSSSSRKTCWLAYVRKVYCSDLGFEKGDPVDHRVLISVAQLPGTQKSSINVSM